ncbi:MAG TPA: response regulator [Thermoanaerobaculia bacterium]|nr:response regulator [Thermoanaerobaculia bacterium]
MTTSARQFRVLVADDDPAIRSLVARIFIRRGYDVASASDGADAIQKLDHDEPYDLLVLDLMMPRVDGVGVINHLAKRDGPRPAILVMTAAVPDILRRLPREHVAKVISKPFDLDQLTQYADEAIRETNSSAS